MAEKRTVCLMPLRSASARRALCYARKAFLMKTHVFGEPSALFADPPKDLVRVADETALGRLLQDREVVVVADAPPCFRR